MIEAGDTAVFDLSVTNRGDTGTCHLNYWSYRGTDGWKIRFVDNNDREVYRMLIPAGETKPVRLLVETSGDAAVGGVPDQGGDRRGHDLGLCQGYQDPRRGDRNPRGHGG